MTELPEYLNLFVNVTLEVDGTVTCRPNELNIPSRAVATITWIPAAENFVFRAFHWCNSNGFFTQDPIIHDTCVIAAAQNLTPENQGTFAYRLTVASHDCEHSTEPCPGPGAQLNGQPKIHTQ